MIYEKIATTLNNYLGEEFLINYANNHDTEWDKILPDVVEETAYGVLRVDSGRTLQVGGMPVKSEQLTLSVAIPAANNIFSRDVGKLRTMITGLNNEIVYDDDVSAMLLFGEYQDANQIIVNGNYWWIASVIFTSNFYENLYVSSDVVVKVNNTAIQGIISVNYSREFVMDSMVMLNDLIPANKVNNKKKTLNIQCVCLKSDTLIQTLFSNEDSITSYTIIYNDGIVNRSFSALLGVINEQAIMGDIIKVNLIFVEKQ